MTSTLTKLKINVEIFATCPYFLDGHLSYLTTLIIHAKRILYSFSETDSTVSVISTIVFSGKTLKLNRQTFLILYFLWKKLPKLKCFSSISVNDTSRYYNRIDLPST
jgi:hypothetical protein